MARELTPADIGKWGVRTGYVQSEEPINEATVALVVAWIREHCEPARGIRRSPGRNPLAPVSSYGWKHAAERALGWPRVYVSNGEFIIAAMRAGYRAVRATWRGPNALFNMRPRPARRTAHGAEARP